MAVIYPTDVHPDVDKARLGVMAAAASLDVQCDCKLQTMWMVKIDNKDVPTFIEFAKDLVDIASEDEG
jgi:hypothetical protein